MNGYKGYTKCDKCHSIQDHRVEYQCRWDMEHVITAEWMMRTCNNCGYQWREACADAEG